MDAPEGRAAAEHTCSSSRNLPAYSPKPKHLANCSEMMMRRLLSVIALVALLVTVFTAPASAAPHCGSGQEPQFLFGFAHFKSLLGDKIGQPVECEHANPDNGDTLQQTTTGLAFYRKSTNTPTFTDGWNHWAWTTDGLVYWTGSSIDLHLLGR